MSKDNTGEHTGLSVSYYKVAITTPTTPGAPPYVAECNDIIEALEMTPAEANVFKAIWRSAAERTLGKKKAGNNAVYDAEKMVFFSNRVLVQAKARAAAQVAAVKPVGVLAKDSPARRLHFDVPTGVVPRYQCDTDSGE